MKIKSKLEYVLELSSKDLKRIYSLETDGLVRLQIVQKVNNKIFLKKVALEDQDYEVRIEAVNKLEDQKLIEKIALKDSYYKVRIAAAKRLTDQDRLQYIALNTIDVDVRVAALNNITSEEFLIEYIIAKRHYLPQIFYEVLIDRINNEEMLYKILLAKVCYFFNYSKIIDKINKESILEKLAFDVLMECEIRELAIKKNT